MGEPGVEKKKQTEKTGIWVRGGEFGTMMHDEAISLVTTVTGPPAWDGGC